MAHLRSRRPVFREWVKGSHVILDRNPDYWDKPKPYLDRVFIRFIADGSARAAAFEARELDLGGDTPVSMADLERIKSISYLAIEAICGSVRQSGVPST